MEIGTELYYLKTSRNQPNEIQKVIVTSIGTKYFYVDNDIRRKFRLEDLKYESERYSQNNLQLYKTEQEIKDLEEYRLLFDKIVDAFHWSKRCYYNLQQLINIDKILSE